MTALQRKEPGDPRAKAIEAMARAICKQYGWVWEKAAQDGYRATARAALTALAVEGLVLTDTREVERLREANEKYKRALEWIAKPSGVAAPWSPCAIAREALSSMPVEEKGD